jgi:5'-nucleotidase
VNILLTNDDGVAAPGLAALYRAAQSLGSVTVAAPKVGQSATSHGLTVNRPLAVARRDVAGMPGAYVVDGRPVDCVKLALQRLAPQVDVVLSGINDGANVSTNVLYSGTVAAAAEGALAGMPAVAVSLEHGDSADYDGAAAIAVSLVRGLLERGFAPGSLYNINVPALGPGRPLGIRVAPHSDQQMTDHYHAVEGPDGMTYYWLDGEFDEPQDSSGDLASLLAGYVVITPLRFNVTDQAHLAEMATWQWPSVIATAAPDA